MVHHRSFTIDGLGLLHWVSLDGDSWVPVNRGPEPDEPPSEVEAKIAELFYGDGNFMPMTFATRYLDYIEKHEGQPA